MFIQHKLYVFESNIKLKTLMKNMLFQKNVPTSEGHQAVSKSHQAAKRNHSVIGKKQGDPTITLTQYIVLVNGLYYKI